MDTINFLNNKAYNLRVDVVRATTTAGSGHTTSCLSAADIMSGIFFHALHCDYDDYENPYNDRFILSKGHAAPLLYAVYKSLGKISDDELLSLRKLNSPLEGHLTRHFKYTEAATGSLGQGLSVAVGMALVARSDKLPFFTYVLLGDGELAEGSNWEAINSAAYYKLDTIIACIDFNRLGQTSETMYGHDFIPLADQFKAFGWNVHCIDGHDMHAIVVALDLARASCGSGKPTVIIAKTYKGYGLNNQIENQDNVHGTIIPPEKLDYFLDVLAQRFPEAAHDIINQCHKKSIFHVLASPHRAQLQENSKKILVSHYVKGDLIPTRKAFGQGLVACGNANDSVVCLDAEMKNSTYIELFEDAFSDRFYQCFIAEQLMIGVAVGMKKRGKIPFCATFASFLTRAYDQIRMAAIGGSALCICGSHGGVSVGPDGPSQMGLEDIAIMRAIPDSIVLYPCDAVSTYACVALMMNYNQGISYIRTTRVATPVLYDNQEEFIVGGCKQLKKSSLDTVCVIAAGITVHEALKAYEILQASDIVIRVIDCYSVKPLPEDELIQSVHDCGGNVVVVEDHYTQGGLGEAVARLLCNHAVFLVHLSVTELSRSGMPYELLTYHSIDAQAIVQAVHKVLAKKSV